MEKIILLYFTLFSFNYIYLEMLVGQLWVFLMPHSTYASCFFLCRWPLPSEFFSVFAPPWGRGSKPDHFLPDLTAAVKTVLLGHLGLTCGFLKGRSLSVLYTIYKDRNFFINSKKRSKKYLVQDPKKTAVKPLKRRP